MGRRLSISCNAIPTGIRSSAVDPVEMMKRFIGTSLIESTLPVKIMFPPVLNRMFSEKPLKDIHAPW
jgi:hypothetical protein